MLRGSSKNKQIKTSNKQTKTNKMKNSKMLTGSICLTDLIDNLKLKNPAFTKASNGKIYVNVVQFINNSVDLYGNISSLQISKPKESVQSPIYIGNFKEFLLPEINHTDLDNIDFEQITRGTKEYTLKG